MIPSGTALQQKDEDEEDDSMIQYEEAEIDIEQAIERLPEFEGEPRQFMPKRRRKNFAQLRYRFMRADTVDHLRYETKDQKLDHRSITLAFKELVRIVQKDDDPENTKELMDKLLLDARKNLTQFVAQELGSLLWCFSHMGIIPMEDGFVQILKSEILNRCQNKASDINPQAIASVLRGLSQMGDYDKQLFNVMSECLILTQDMYFNPQSIPSILQAYAKFNHQDPRLFDVLLKKSYASGYKFNANQIVKITVSSARLNVKHLGFLNEAVKFIVQTSNDAECQHLSNMIWSLAQLGIPNLSMVLAVCQQIKIRPKDFQAFELSQICWALAQFQHHEDQDALQAICDRIKEVVKKFKLHHLSSTLWAITKLRFHDQVLYDTCAKRIISRAGDLTPECICQIAWAYSKARHKHKELFESLADIASVSLMRKFDLLQFNTLIWSFSNIKFHDKRLFDGIARTSIQRLPEFDAAHLATFAKGFSQVGHKDVVFVRAIVSEAKTRLQEFNIKQLSDLVVASVSLGYADIHLLSESVEQLTQVLGKVPDSIVPKILSSYAECKYYHPGLFRRACERLLSMPFKHLSGAWISQVIYPLAVLGRNDESTVVVAQHIQKSSRRQVARFPNALLLTRCAWAMASFESLWDRAWWESISLAFYDAGRESLRREELILTGNILILHEVFCQNKVLTMPKEVMDAAMNQLKTESQQRSSRQLEVIEEIKQMVNDFGLHCIDEPVGIHHDCFSVDVAVSGSDQQSIGIMLDDESGFYVNDPEGLTGLLACRNNLILKLGSFVKIVQINLKKWQQLSQEQKIEQLGQQLEELFKIEQERTTEVRTG